MATPTYIIVTVALKEDDTPARPIEETMNEIADSRIEGIVGVRAAHNETDFGWLVPVGPETVVW